MGQANRRCFHRSSRFTALRFAWGDFCGNGSPLSGFHERWSANTQSMIVRIMSSWAHSSPQMPKAMAPTTGYNIAPFQKRRPCEGGVMATMTRQGPAGFLYKCGRHAPNVFVQNRELLAVKKCRGSLSGESKAICLVSLLSRLQSYRQQPAVLAARVYHILSTHTIWTDKLQNYTT